MTFGYENEFFLLKDGKVLEQVPDYHIPHDAYGILAEVRSEPFENPFDTLKSYYAKLKELEALVAKHDCTLHNIAEHPIASSGRKLETAGFHIHFGKQWDITTVTYGLNNQYVAPPDIAAIIARLNRRFEPYYKGIQRHPHHWRPKAHGWEYRRLPATVDPAMVTLVLAEEFLTADTRLVA